LLGTQRIRVRLFVGEDGGVHEPEPNPRTELGGSSVALGRQYPHAILVNAQGRRFCNESNSYLEVGKAMYAQDGVPAWLIFDDQFRRRYPWVRSLPKLRNILSVLPGRMPQELVTSGWIKSAETIEDLARLIDRDPQALVSTVRRFNEQAAKGQDPDFGRGESQYNRVLGDPGNKPNQALGPIDTAPFYATEIYPGDVGTTGGVITDEHAQGLDESDTPIPGLYATGNMAATVMGRGIPAPWPTRAIPTRLNQARGPASSPGRFVPVRPARSVRGGPGAAAGAGTGADRRVGGSRR
jgi:3-oxosteroid 1-dehydrogenase